MLTVVRKIPKKHKMFIISIAVLMIGLTLIPTEKATASKDNNSDALKIGKRYELAIELNNSIKTPQTNQQQKTVNEDILSFKHFTVKKGDNLAKIFKRAGFSATTLHKLLNTNKQTKSLKNIYPGEVLSFATDENNNLSQLKYKLNKTDTLITTLNNDDKYTTYIESKKIEIVTKSSWGEINSNFWTAGIEAGLNEKQIMNFADIFGWDVDFANDIRKHDQFTLIYETHHVEGEYIGTGKILAAEFINQGEKFSAVLHEDGNFYTPQGRSMKKAFLRAPVNFKYISSSFNPRRKHPVTGRVKAHRGIDYAARAGTPVVASGNGRVIKSGYSKYNGHYVFIQHGSKYVTKYLHLKKRKVKKGQKVKQNQLIGTVGATGQVTGAHLHYEFLVNGVHRNPKTIKLPKSASLPKAELAKFKPIAEQYIAKLDQGRTLQLALNTQ